MLMEKARKAITGFFAGKKVRTAAYIALAIMLGFFLIQITNSAVRSRTIDFTTYVTSAKALLNGHMPYDTGKGYPFVYPVFFAFLFIPFTVLPYAVSDLLWYFLGLLAFYYSIFIMVEKAKPMLGIKDKKQAYVPLIFLAVLFLPFLQHNFVNGESNAFILLFTVLFFKYYHEDKILSSAFFLALGVSIKLVPLIFVVFLLYRRRFDYFFLTLAFIAALLLSPALIAGSKIFDYYRYYWDNFIVAEAGVSGLLNREEMFFTTSRMISWLLPGVLMPNKVPMLAGLLINGMILLAAEIINTLKKGGKNGDIWLFNVYLIVMLMTMPKSQYHHLLYMSAAAAMVFIRIFYDKDWFNAQSLSAAAVFLAFFYAGKVIRHGPYFYVFLVILLAACLIAVYQAGEKGRFKAHEKSV
jgi:hypothetical protein